MAYSWEGAFLKGGLSVFDEATVETFKRIQNKYAMDYVPYLDKMIRSVGKELSAPVKELKVTVQSLIRDIGVVLSGKMTGTGSEKLIQRIQQEMMDVEKGLKYIRQQSLDSKRFGKAAELAERLTGVSLEELKQSQEAIGEKMTDIKPEKHGLLETVKKKTPALYEAGQGVAGSLATAFLGPFSGITKLLGTTGIDMYKAIKERQMEKKEKKIATALTPMSKEYDEGMLESLYKKQGQGIDLQKILQGSGFGKNDKLTEIIAELSGAGKHGKGKTVHQADTPRKRSGAKEAAQATMLPFLGVERGVGEKTDIFLFFDKFAHKAKWTREVLESLKKIQKEDAHKMGTSIMPLGSMAGLLPFLGAAGAVLGAGALGVVATKLLQKLEDVNKPMRKGIAMMQPFMMGGNLLDPKRSYKLMVEGYADINKMLFARLEKPIREFEASFSKLGNLFKTFTEGAGKKFGTWFTNIFGGAKEEQAKKAGVIDPATASETTLIVPKVEQQQRPGKGAPLGKTVTAEGKPAKAAFEEKNSTDIRFEKLMGGLEKLIDKLGAGKSGSGYHSVSKSSKDDANGTGDTRLDLLNSGALGLAD